MNRLYKKLLYLLIPVFATVIIVGCEDDEEMASFEQPEIMELSVTEGLIGAEVTIKGENFSDVVGVKFGNIDINDFEKSSNSIKLNVPDGLAEGETKITVYYAGPTAENLGPSASIPFKVIYPPVLTEVVPEQSRPGFEVSLKGNYLAGATSLKFGDVVTPFDAKQSSITVKVPNLEPGDVEVTVETPGGTAKLSFTVLEKSPEIFSFEPTDGLQTGDKIKISGVFFVDVESVKIGNFEVEDYTVKSETEIELTIPVGAGSDNISVTTALGTATSNNALNFIEMPFVVLDEGAHKGIQNWGWGGTDNYTSDVVALTGSTSYERTYNDAWSGLTMHHGSVDLSPYTGLKFSIYGGPGTDGKKLNLNINWGTAVSIEVVEGEWKEYIIHLDALGSPTNFSDIVFQDNGDSEPAAPFTIYLDNIQFIE